MIKAKDISLNNLVIFLVLSLTISALMFIPKPKVASTKSLPVFMGEEIVVHKTNVAAKVNAPTKVEAAVKATALPMPQPKVINPLPLIPPTVLSKILPAYPQTALEKGLEGTVLLSIYIGLNGLPEKIETKTSSGVQELDESATNAISHWKFSPATQGGSSLASWFEVPVSFRIK